MRMEQQHIDLVKRTLDNLNFIYQFTGDEIPKRTFGSIDSESGLTPSPITYSHSQSSANKVWEVTQIINSFLGIVAHPRERLLDRSKIKWITLNDQRVVSLGLPEIKSSWEFDSEEPRTISQLLRLLRNGIAHGNIELYGIQDLKKYGKDVPGNSSIDPQEIAGIEIWNEDNSNSRTWGTILTIDELARTLNAFALLALDESWHEKPQKERNGGRKGPPAEPPIPNGNSNRGRIGTSKANTVRGTR